MVSRRQCFPFACGNLTAPYRSQALTESKIINEIITLVVTNRFLTKYFKWSVMPCHLNLLQICISVLFKPTCQPVALSWNSVKFIYLLLKSILLWALKSNFAKGDSWTVENTMHVLKKFDLTMNIKKNQHNHILMNHSLRTRFIVLQLELEGIQYNTIVNDNTRYTPYYTSTNFIITSLIKRYFACFKMGLIIKLQKNWSTKAIFSLTNKNSGKEICWYYWLFSKLFEIEVHLSFAAKISSRINLWFPLLNKITTVCVFNGLEKP